MSALHSLSVLVVGDDPQLAQEVEVALESATPARTVVRFADSFHEGAGAFRTVSPDLVCVALTGKVADFAGFVRDVRALDPDAQLVGVRDPRLDERDESPLLVEAVRSGLADVVERPVSSRDLLPALARVGEGGRSSAGTGHVTAFHSTKGGVGKSTLSINTACALALRNPDDVLLVDCSLQLGVCSAALDLPGASSVADAVREQDRLDTRLLRELAEPHPKTGLRILAAPRDAIEASDVDDQGMARVLGLARRAFRHVVVDTLPIVDGVMLTILDLSDAVYLVNQGTVPDVIGAARLLEVLDEIGVDASRRRIVLNRTMPRFPGRLAASEVSARLNQPVDFEVPYDRKVFTALNLGQPRVLESSRLPWATWPRVLNAIADDIEERAAALAEERRGADARDFADLGERP
ncbi:MAG: AAA family ATPase [Myxococcota bacterium]